MIDFLCQIKILPLKMLKLIKIPGFSRFFSKFLKFQVFPGYVCLNCRIPGYSRFPGKVATLSRIKSKMRPMQASIYYIININLTNNN